MQKTDFVKSVADRANVSQKEAKQVIDAALDIITESLKGGEKVTLTGFGTFEVRQRQEREGDHIGDWGYDEVTAVDENYLRHEVLFSTGTTILIEFKHFSYEREDCEGTRYQCL